MADYSMSGKPGSLKQAITVDNVGHNVYRSTNLWRTKSMRTAYGGQLAAQAMNAAVQTVSDQAFLVHSIHCYFVGTTAQGADLFYHVERVKDGTSFCSRYVKAVQADKTVFQCMVSFYKPGEASAGLDHKSSVMPDVPAPESEVPSSSDYSLIYINMPSLLELYHCAEKKDIPKFLRKQPAEPKMLDWVKVSSEHFAISDGENFHRTALLYASDMTLGGTIFQKYPTLRKSSLYTSLDHALWFHAPVRADQWHLMVAECEHATGGRSLSVCRIYSQDGSLVATCKQEFFVRPKL